MPVALMLVSLEFYLHNGDGKSGCPHRYSAAVNRVGAHGVPPVKQGGSAATWFPKNL